MTCQRIEELLSAYLEGDLGAAERAEVESHLAACPGCAALAGLMKETIDAAKTFPEVEPSPALYARLYGIGKAGRARRPFARTVFEWLTRPALQPVFATLAGVLIVLSFVLFHPEGRGIRKQIDLRLHQGIGTVEKLYAEAGTIKGEIKAFSANVVRSFNTLGILGGDEKKQ